MEPADIIAATNTELADLLARFDADERDDRVRRLKEVNEILAGGAGAGFWHSAGDEASWLLAEAKDAYVYGLPAASLLSSHAACERRLAGIMVMYPDDKVPDEWERWGLGRLTSWAVTERHLPDAFEPRLRRVTARRNALGHFRRPVAKDTVVYRAVREADATDSFEVDLATTLENDALDALATTYELYSALSGFP